LKGYDYTQAGAYFVTIYAQGRAYIFGEIDHENMILNEAGRMIQTVWDDMPAYYAGIETDAFIIMPNHIHGIIVIADSTDITTAVGAGPRACPDYDDASAIHYDRNIVYPNNSRPMMGPTIGQRTDGQPQGVAPTATAAGMENGGIQTALSLPDMVHRFKSMTTHQYIHGVKHSGWPPFPGRLWQRNYWEYIVRNEQDLNHLRGYIRFNPEKWALDELMVAH